MEKAKRLLLGVLGVIAGYVVWQIVHRGLVFVFELAAKIPLLRTIKVYRGAVLLMTSLVPTFFGVELGGRVASKIGQTARIFAWVVIALYILEAVLTIINVGFLNLLSSGLMRIMWLKWVTGVACAAELMAEFKYE